MRIVKRKRSYRRRRGKRVKPHTQKYHKKIKVIKKRDVPIREIDDFLEDAERKDIEQTLGLFSKMVNSGAISFDKKKRPTTWRWAKET